MELSGNKLSKEQILQLIDELRKNPSNYYQIITDLGATGAGIAGGIAAFAKTSFVQVGWGITALTGAYIPVAPSTKLVVGASVVGGALTYATLQAVRFKARQYGKREQMLQQMEEKRRDIEYEEQKSETTEAEKLQFILFLKEPVRLELVSSRDASDLIQLVMDGKITLSEAYKLVEAILKDFNLDKEKKSITLLPKLLPGTNPKLLPASNIGDEVPSGISNQKTLIPKDVFFWNIFLVICAVVFPPAVAFLAVGFRLQFWLNIVLTMLGWIPGVTHALWVSSVSIKQR